MIAGEENNNDQRTDKKDIRELGVGERKEMRYHRTDRQDQYVNHHIIAMRLMITRNSEKAAIKIKL